MALVLIKEDGTGVAGANSYADAADGDAYFEGHLYGGFWTLATTERKEQALVFATRLIDSQFQFNGYRASEGQELQWPRQECPDPDKGVTQWARLLAVTGNFVESDAVPQAVVNATCELAKDLLASDRTLAPAGEGVYSQQASELTRDDAGNVSSTSNKTVYSKSDTRRILSHVAEAMLMKFGAPMGSGRAGMVRLRRS